MKEINEVYAAAIERQRATIADLKAELAERAELLEHFERVVWGYSKDPGEKEARGSTKPPRRKLAKGKPWSKKQHEKYAASILARRKKEDKVLGEMAEVSTRRAKEFEAKRKAKKEATDKSRPKWANGEPVTTGEAAAGERIPKPTTPPSTNGSLSKMTQKEAILRVLESAARPLTADELLGRLRVGGWHSRSENPRAALSVRLSEMHLAYETRAGKAHYQPIKPTQIEGEA